VWWKAVEESYGFDGWDTNNLVTRGKNKENPPQEDPINPRQNGKKTPRPGGRVTAVKKRRWLIQNKKRSRSSIGKKHATRNRR